MRHAVGPLVGACSLAPSAARPRLDQGVSKNSLAHLAPFGANRIQRPHGPAAVVLVVAHDHSLRDSVERRRAYGDRGDILLHPHSVSSSVCSSSLRLLPCSSRVSFIKRATFMQWNLTPCYGQHGRRRPHTTQPVRRGCSARRSRVPAAPWQRGTRLRSRRRNIRTPVLRASAARTTRPLVPDLARPRSASYRGLSTRSSSVARLQPGTAVHPASRCGPLRQRWKAASLCRCPLHVVG